jgi:hypothetical protein
MKVKILLFLVISFLLVVSCETTGSVSATPAPEPVAPAEPADKPVTTEYARSVATLGSAISEDTFLKDKESIMKIIADLETAMKTQNVATWRKYLSPSSVAYLKNPRNLQAVSSRLPAPLQLRTDADYFKYVFTPSRQRPNDELRYVSPVVTKVVQVRENDDVVNYYFEKINGIWLVNLDENQN